MTRKTDIEDLRTRLLARPGDRRVIVAIAGPPGSGKSSVAGALAAALNRARPGVAALLEMDGYHYDDRVLSDLGRLSRKGAPDTFDVGGLVHMLARLRADDEDVVAAPVFDRDIEIARAGARLIPRDSRIIVAEGNYLLLDQPPWGGLAAGFDITVMIETDAAVLRERLTRRWARLGVPAAEAARKVENNDMPNGRFVTANSRAADYSLAT